MKKNDRLAVLGNNLGIWYLDFYLSWLRLKNAGSKHFVVSYEDHLARNSGDKQALLNALISYLDLNETEISGLRGALLSEDFSKSTARFNKGQTGRGQELPEEVRQHIMRHAMFFKDELTETHRRALFGDDAC